MYLRESAPGHLAPIDAPLLALLCCALARADEAEAQLGSTFLVRGQKGIVRHPLLVVIAQQAEIARRVAAELCLPPSQRNRLGVNEPPPDDPAARYF